ncbi:flavoprotein [Kitasatospora sp. NBC_01287]|uniref:flavoprotein n=1 Tax=Kitasatospora sp. NBC_01287 TaxID=2903573 RepID=UPI002258A4AA|nr:flavoprotein [Kitasatospora sp. NBC_01287]MCX4748195.1 flavoprotein [Kitasatospora sp. NBC_01287]
MSERHNERQPEQQPEQQAEQQAERATPQPQRLSLRSNRVLLVATGSIMVAHLPTHLTWVRHQQPSLEVQVVLTRSAGQFVSKEALHMISGRPVLDDAWEPGADTSGARHVEWSRWAELAVVWPATMHYTARLALGLADSPSLLALHCTGAPVGVAPSLPPGGWQSAAMSGHVAALEARPGVKVIPPVPGLSWTTKKLDSWLCPPLGAVLRDLDEWAHDREVADERL